MFAVSNASIREMWEQHALLREGFKTKVYLDSRGFPTVGIGHLVTAEDNLEVGDEVSAARVFELFDKDSRKAIEAAKQQAKEIGHETAAFIVALTSVNFQLGTKWHRPAREGGKGFVNTYAALKNGEYDRAIKNLYSSAWYKQTPVRVHDFIDAINRIKKPLIFTAPKKPTIWERFTSWLDNLGVKNA